MNSLNYRAYIILDAVWRRRYVITVPVLIMPLLGLLVGILSPKLYTSYTSMLIQETAKMNPFLADLAVSAKLKERMAALETLLHSRHILGKVAETRGFIDKDTSAHKYDQVIQELSQSLSMSLASEDLIRIDYKSHSPVGMRETLEAISTHFVEQLIAPERSSMNDSSHFLEAQLSIRQKELDEAEAALASFKNEYADQLPELHPSMITRLAKLKQLLSVREAELAGAKKNLGGLDQQLSKTNPIVGRIEEQIVQIRGDLILLRSRYTDQHSQVQSALRNLRRLEQERLKVLRNGDETIDSERLWDIASRASTEKDDTAHPLLISQLENLQNARSKVNALQEETASLHTMIKELELRTTSFGAQEHELSKLTRDLKVKRSLYDDLLQRYEMARVTGSLGDFEFKKRVKVIDRPFKPTTPATPSLILFMVAGLLGGIFLGAGLALMMEATDSSIRRREQLQALSNVAVISRLPPLTPSC